MCSVHDNDVLKSRVSMAGNSELHIVGSSATCNTILSSGFSKIGVFRFHQGVRFPDRKRGKWVDSNSGGVGRGWKGRCVLTHRK